MSNMCTCHICPDSCEWCRLQKVKQVFSSLKSQHPAIREVLWALHKLEDYMIADTKRSEFTAVDFLKGLEGFENTCASCKFYDPRNHYCKEHQLEINKHTPKCPEWRYFA